MEVFNRLVQVNGQNLLSTGLLQIVSTSCNKSANDKLRQGCNLSFADLLQLNKFKTFSGLKLFINKLSAASLQSSTGYTIMPALILTLTLTLTLILVGIC